MPPLSALAPLDYLGLIVLGVFALDGVRRGLLLGALDLVVLAATLTAAVALYPLVGGALTEKLALPGALTNVAAFAAIVLVIQIAYGIASSVLRTLLRPVYLAMPPFRVIDFLGGLLPGFAKGAIVVGVLASTVRSLPMAADLK